MSGLEKMDIGNFYSHFTSDSLLALVSRLQPFLESTRAFIFAEAVLIVRPPWKSFAAMRSKYVRPCVVLSSDQMLEPWSARGCRTRIMSNCWKHSEESVLKSVKHIDSAFIVTIEKTN